MVLFKRLEIWLVLGILLTVAIRCILLTQKWRTVHLSDTSGSLAHPLLALHAERHKQTTNADTTSSSRLVITATPHPTSQPTIHSTSLGPTSEPTAGPSVKSGLLHASGSQAKTTPTSIHQSTRSPTHTMSVTPGSEIRTSGVIVRKRSIINTAKSIEGAQTAQIESKDGSQTSTGSGELSNTAAETPSTSRRVSRDQEGPPSVYDIHGEGSVLYKVHPLRQRKHWKDKKRKNKKGPSLNTTLIEMNHSLPSHSLLLFNMMGNSIGGSIVSGAATGGGGASQPPPPPKRDSAGKGEVVLLSWPRASDQFGYLNYKALESWLHIWPAAQVRVLVFAPQYALNYKFADALSVMQFQKYQKRGYDVTVELLHANSSPKLWPLLDSTLTTLDKQQQLYPGQKYFNMWCTKGLFGQGIPFRAFKGVRRAIPRFELWAFSLLARTWATGGVISDFTTFATNAPTGWRGLDLCPNPTPQSTTLEPHDASADLPDVETNGARSVSVNIFSWLSSVSNQPDSRESSIGSNRANGAVHSGPVSVKQPTSASSSIGPFSSLVPPPPTDLADAAAAMAASGCDGGMAARFGPFDPVLRCLLESYDAALEVLCDRDCLRHRASLCAIAEEQASISSQLHSSGSSSSHSRSNSTSISASGDSAYSATGAMAVLEARRAAKAAKVAARAVDKARAKADKIRADLAATGSFNDSSNSLNNTSTFINSSSGRDFSNHDALKSHEHSLAAALPSPNVAAAAVSALHWPPEPFTLHLVNWRNCDRSLPSLNSEVVEITNVQSATSPPPTVAAAAAAVAAADAAESTTREANMPKAPPLLWLGPDSTSGQWRSPRASGPAVAAAVGSLRLHRWPPLLQHHAMMGNGEGVKATSSSNVSSISGSSSGRNASCPSDILARQFHACTVFSASSQAYDDDHGGYENNGISISSRSTSTATSSSFSSQVNAVRRMRCTPSFFLAGASKSASTWLFNLLALHPQILRPLEGAGFKEAGAYALKNGRHAGVGSNLASKLHRFPFIEAMEMPETSDETNSLEINETTQTIQQQTPFIKKVNGEMNGKEDGQHNAGDVLNIEVEQKPQFEPFVSADGSVGYMFESAGIPQQIRDDTRGNAKVIFVVREPVERTWSDYRYLAHNYVPHRISFDKIALPAATALAQDTCFGLRILNGTLKEAMAAEEASAAAATSASVTAVESPPDALRYRSNSAQNTTTNDSAHQEPPQQQYHKRHQGRLFPTEAFYHSSCGRVAADPHQLVKKSLYVFMVLHWRAHWGPSNVLVVDAADFRGYASGDNNRESEEAGGKDAEHAEGGTRNSIDDDDSFRGARAFAQVVQFLGLCPWQAEAVDVPSRANVGRRGKDDLPRKLRLDVRGQRFLGDFFAPYDAALEQVVGRSFDWQETRARNLALLEAEAQAAHLAAEEAQLEVD